MAIIGGATSDWRHGTVGALTSLTDFTAKTKKAAISNGSETVESTAFGSVSRSFIQSFKNGTIETMYIYDATVWGQLSNIYSTQSTVSFQLSPDAVTSGKPKMTGSVFITKLDISPEIGNLLEISVSWQVTGDVTFGTHA